ncbi:unnamed protein product [Ceutorhynchus assimilis]|uniref:Tetraspanin n=1 Tax=Ceutorhynchus assimilis TaxID=467358 RepID=A0A9N9M8I3_9CUCU|nr:unnamed protein product [Ceutorhynchus assimilis]
MVIQKDLDFGMKCIKYMLCVANLMFVIVGLLLISIGYTIKSIYSNFEQFMETYYYNPSSLAIIIGIFIFVIALFGCVGAVRESTCLVNTYAFFLTIVLVMEISVSIAAYAMRSNIESNIAYNMKFAMDHFNEEYNAFTWNSTQYNLQCCGIYRNTEWGAYPEYNLTKIVLADNTTLSVPPTCCQQEKCSPATVYTSGCLFRLSYVVSQCALLLAAGALCVSFIQVLGIVFASMLAKSIRKAKTERLVRREELRRNFYDQMMKSRGEKPEPVVELYTPKDSEA